MGVKSSTIFTLAAGVVLGGLCFAGLQKAPIAHAQTKLTPFTPRTISMSDTDDMAGLEKTDKATTDLVEFVEPGVVHIISSSRPQMDIMGHQIVNGGEGSGVVYRPDGYILTNDHVVGGFDKVTVVFADGHQLPGTVIRASDMDLAVVKVDAKDLPTLPFADSSKVKSGQFAMAVGSPFGLDNTVTFGHISALGRTNTIRDERLNMYRNYPDLIQTDTPINMGNSGGPLVNVHGEVVGINTAIYSQTGNYNGIGFAIPSNTATLIADKLIETGKVQRGALGLQPRTLEAYKAKEMGIDGGAVVDVVVNGTPAAMAGIKKDDVIVRVGNVAIKSETDVRDSMLHYSPGETVDIEVIRDKDHKTIHVTLTSQDKLPQPRDAAPQPNRDVDPFKDFQVPGFGDQQNGVKPDRSGSAEKKTGNAQFGVTVTDITAALREQFHIPNDVQGAVIMSVLPGSAADSISLQVGDVIQELGGKTVDGAASLKDAMAGRKWGETCTVKFGRFGDHTSMTSSIPFNF